MIIFEKAKNISLSVREILLPHVEKINIVGSVRREKFEVHDIELVCQKKMIAVNNTDLFETKTTGYETHPEFIKAVNSLGKIIKGKPSGRFVQLEVPNTQGGIKTIQLDLFIAQPHDYYRIMAIRTGSSSYSQNTIAFAWKKKGWCGTPDGLRLQEDCKPAYGKDNKVVWTCVAINPVTPPEWNSEKEFFEWLGVPYIHPRNRN